MKKILVSCVVCIYGFVLIAQTGKGLDTMLYFNEVDGLVVVEMESINPTGNWIEKTDRDGFAGTSFFEWGGPDLFVEPGSGLLNYIVKINTPGQYRFQWHSKVGHGSVTTEANDSWLRIPDAKKFYSLKTINSQDTVYPRGVCTTHCPEGAGKNGWFKVYCPGTFEWTWSTVTYDRNSHLIFADFDRPGFYTIQISGRSSHHLIDRFVLYQSNVNAPTDLKKYETKVSYIFDIAKVGYKIQNRYEGILDAVVVFDGDKKITDKNGGVFFYDIPVGFSYDYSIQKNSYWEVEDRVMINGDTIIPIQLSQIPDNLVDLKFIVTNSGGRPIREAKVLVDNKVKYTNVNGNVSFEGYVKNTSLPFTILRDGYNSVTDSVFMTSDTVINVKMNLLGTHLISNREVNKQLQLKPNPARDIISICSPLKIEVVYIFDVNGRLLMSLEGEGKKSIDIDINHLNKGVYLINLKSTGSSGANVRRFLKG